MKTRIVGDVHGKVPGYIKKIQGSQRSVQVGDFGFSKDYNRRGHFVKKEGLDPNSHVFFGGNHDDYDNLPDFHLGDYGTLPWDESVFFVRGARSIDRKHRTEGVDWWREEELGYKKMKKALVAYKKARPRVVLTHDGPPEATENLFPSKQIFKTSTGQLLSALFEAHKPDMWIFGHWHHNRTKNVKGTRFFCLGELSSLDLSYKESVDTYKVHKFDGTSV
jgi:predicted phosphodiesterase